ncbi:MAG: hypothetical protein GXO32_01815 [Crenarchaeota archaeon]|nr:hypothetical protein [Thermoproteota archaeon]
MRSRSRSLLRRGGVSLLVVMIIIVVIAAVGAILLGIYLQHVVKSAPPLPVTITASGARYNMTFGTITVTVTNGPMHALVINNVTVIGGGCRILKVVPQLPIVIPPSAHHQSFVVIVYGGCVAKGTALVAVTYTDTTAKTSSIKTVKVAFT